MRVILSSIFPYNSIVKPLKEMLNLWELDNYSDKIMTDSEYQSNLPNLIGACDCTREGHCSSPKYSDTNTLSKTYKHNKVQTLLLRQSI